MFFGSQTEGCLLNLRQVKYIQLYQCCCLLELNRLNMLEDCRKIESFDALETECCEVEDLV